MRLFFLFIAILSLSACTSSSYRAPVSDITLASTTKLPKKVIQTSVQPSIKPKKAPQTDNKTYKVKKGDTLYSIAWKAGVSVDALTKRNHIVAPYTITQGQILHLVNLSSYTQVKSSNKSDLASQNVIKKSNTACSAQNCQKNNQKKVVQEKTKAYPRNDTNKKIIATKDKDNIQTEQVSQSKAINNKKVSDWSWPVKGKLTKHFSSSQSSMQGISIVNERGTPILATALGQVVYAGSGLRGYGKLIIIKHNSDYLSAYAHNEKLLVKENDQIKEGQKIALMGDSGTDHVHLHFEIRYKGKSVDPLRYLPNR